MIANGTVKVDRNLKAIQHRDGGIVKTIAIREGDTVRKGQVLIALEDVQTRAELSIVRAQVAELSARRARPMAERDSLDQLVFPEDLVGLDKAAWRRSSTARAGSFMATAPHRQSPTEQLEFQVTQFC